MTRVLADRFLYRSARAYYIASVVDPSNLARAEAAISEILGLSNDDVEKVNKLPAHFSSLTITSKRSEEAQQVRWMLLAILKRRRAGEAEFQAGKLTIRV